MATAAGRTTWRSVSPGEPGEPPGGSPCSTRASAATVRSRRSGGRPPWRASIATCWRSRGRAGWSCSRASTTWGARSASGPELIHGLRQIIARAKAQGLPAYRGDAPSVRAGRFYFTPELEAARQAINRWMRAGKDYDAVIDLDAAMRDPKNPVATLSAAAGKPGSPASFRAGLQSPGRCSRPEPVHPVTASSVGFLRIATKRPGHHQSGLPRQDRPAAPREDLQGFDASWGAHVPGQRRVMLPRYSTIE
jgi:hypothetical protein